LLPIVSNSKNEEMHKNSFAKDTRQFAKKEKIELK
jgi:hypothetical protein